MSKDASTLNSKQLREHAEKVREDLKRSAEAKKPRKPKDEDVNQAAFRVVRESTENR